jgi:hypothetical protein
MGTDREGGVMNKIYFLLPGALLVACCSHVPAPVAVGTRLPAVCLKAETNTKYVYLSGTGNQWTASIDLSADGGPQTPGFHHNVALFLSNGSFVGWYDIVSYPCVAGAGGSATFNVHPEAPATAITDAVDGDRWTFSLPAPASGESYTVTDTTSGIFANPVTPNSSGFAVAP